LFLQLLAEPFSVDNGLLTPKLSTKRKAIVDRYKDVLEALYDDEPHLHDTRGAERD
jgi:long-subunit acyl-CoA synthetase (AMP-forming)